MKALRYSIYERRGLSCDGTSSIYQDFLKKKGKIWVLKSRNRLKLAKTVILSFMYVCKKIFWYKLLRNITKFRLKPFLLLLDHFKVPQRQNEGKDKVNLMLKIAKPWSEASRDFLNSFRIVILLKLLWDITTFNSKLCCIEVRVILDDHFI